MIGHLVQVSWALCDGSLTVQDSTAGVTVWAILPAPPCQGPGSVNGHAQSASEA
jgi:hypothetical protein